MRSSGTASTVTLLSLSAITLLVSCRPEEPASGSEGEKEGKPVVYVVNYPLQYFTARIAGDRVRVAFPAPADEDPAYWRPGGEIIVAYQQADIILLNGAGYAGWVAKASLPEAKKVKTSKAFGESLILLDEAVTHSHGPEGEHEHGETAFTTWLDPKLGMQQADAIREALTRLRPDLASTFQQGYQGLEKDLAELDAKQEALLQRVREKPLVASHPVYQYFTGRYGLNVRSVHWEPEEMPTEEMWKELEGLLASHPARHMLWEGPPREDVATKLKALGLESVVYDPCGSAPGEGHFLSVMLRNLANLQNALGD